MAVDILDESTCKWSRRNHNVGGGTQLIVDITSDVQQRGMQLTLRFVNTVTGRAMTSPSLARRLLRLHTPLLFVYTKDKSAEDDGSIEFLGTPPHNSSHSRSKRSLKEPAGGDKPKKRRRKLRRHLSATVTTSPTTTSTAGPQPNDSKWASYYYGYEEEENRQPSIELYTKALGRGPASVLEGRKRQRSKETSRRQRPRYDPNDPWMGFNQPEVDASEEDEDDDEEVEFTRADAVNSGGEEDVTFNLMSEETEKGMKRRTFNSKKAAVCGRHNWKINVADLGWDEWIIAPESFDAGYCAGTCQDPYKSVC